MKKYRVVVISVLFLSIFLTVKYFYKDSTPPNILFISVDTLRQDHVGAYGYQRNITPVLDSLAAEGVKFLNSYSTAPWTLPSHMSMFTGLPPSVHKVDFDARALSREIIPFPLILQQRGYYTGGFVSALYLKETYGFSRGFDSYESDFNADAEVQTDKAIHWIKEREKKPFFLFLHYFDAHWPYKPPLKYALSTGVDTSEKRWKRYGRFSFLRKYTDPNINMSPKIHNKVINLYDAEILRVDSAIGRIVDFLKAEGEYENTIIVITSDHGEEFKEHGSFGHFYQLYTELIRVPMIIRYPGKFSKGTVSDIPVSSMDIASTLIEIAGGEVPDQFLKYGCRLTELVYIKGGKPFQRDLISETRKGCSHHFTVISGEYIFMTPYRYRPMIKNKMWVSVEKKLFNINMDKKEVINLLGAPLTEKLRFGVVVPAEKLIEAYTKKNIDALRIIFFPPSESESVLTGNMSYRSIPDLTPFGVGFGRTDKIKENDDGKSTDFSLTMRNETKEIVLPLSKALQECSDFNIKIYCNRKVIGDRTFNIGKLSKAGIVVKSNQGSVYIMKNGTLYRCRKPGITDREKALLKSLGYIN